MAVNSVFDKPMLLAEAIREERVWLRFQRSAVRWMLYNWLFGWVGILIIRLRATAAPDMGGQVTMIVNAICVTLQGAMLIGNLGTWLFARDHARRWSAMRTYWQAEIEAKQ